MDFVEELKWRGMIQDIMPGTQEKLASGMASGYIGFDPTAPSLHVGSLATVMILVHFQKCGHKPIVLVGGATGMVGDPSGRTEERRLLPIEELRYNQERMKEQLQKFLHFGEGANAAEMVNNYDWFEEVKYLEFLRDVGKHISINYMLAKDSVKLRLEKGISFTEFSYQLLQAYDFYWLYKNMGCILQMGGSDQWGNITTGTELIRRKAGGEAFALTAPLITRSDGSKFGKSEGENIWLDPQQTTPYRFYQYWLNCPDEDAAQYLKIFTLLSKTEIEELERQHAAAPHQRILQKKLGEEITVRVHSKEALKKALEASDILFGKGTTNSLQNFSESEILDIFAGVPHHQIARSELENGTPILDLLAIHTNIFNSKGEARRLLQGGGVSINKEKITDQEWRVTPAHCLNQRFILVQRGKKNYHLITVK
jgi:tyrosyl-tRNA synthetase